MAKNYAPPASKYVLLVKALFIDILVWSYINLVNYKIGWQKIVQNQRYPEFTWNQPLVCLAFGVLVASILVFTRISIGKELVGLISRRASEETDFKRSHFLIYYIVFITFVAGFFISQVSFREFMSEAGLEGARRIFSSLLHPDWKVFEEGLFSSIETIYMAFIATAFAIPVAFFFGFFTSRNLMSGSYLGFAVYTVLRLIFNFSRSIEPLVWAIIFSVWVGIGPFSGMLALFIHSVASLAKQYSEQIESIEDGPQEAIQATGAHPIQVVWFGVVPQIVLPFLSYTIFRWDINVRMATVIGLVGGGGIGNLLMQYQGQARWSEVGMLVIIIAVIVWVMDWASSRIRQALK